ncbi:MAG: response regulator [Acidobacteriota bacterium]
MAQETHFKIYVVDGDEAVRDSMRSLIASLGVEAHALASGEALLEHPQVATASCVVTDVHLPGMSGIELQERLRARAVQAPVIVLASRSDVPTAVRALRNGAMDFIEKPFIDQMLVRSIRQALESHQLELFAASRGGSRREIPFSRRARTIYQLADEAFSPYGTLLLGAPEIARRRVHELNRRPDFAATSQAALRPGLVHALGLQHEFYHRLLDGFRSERDPEILHKAHRWLCERFGDDVVHGTLRRFDELFGSDRLALSAAGESRIGLGNGRRPPRVPELLLEQLLLLWLANQNPAAGPLRELFDDTELAANTPYRQMISSLEEFFDHQPSYGAGDDSLFALMCAPMRDAPQSLGGQLEAVAEIQQNLSDRFVDQLLVGLNVIKEEEKPVFTDFGGPPPSPEPAAMAPAAAAEPASFTADRAWMPELVLIAKHTKVWLHQLSVATGSEVRRLDQIPDTALAEIAGCGFNSLWLFGLWERSPASRQIKRQNGNPEADASAYSLSDYRVAEDLGGEPALKVLEQRAQQHGLRLACDVVPNHMGLDSPWVAEHPEWFLSLEHSPFPSYSFTGEDLSSDPRVGVYLEDHYADRSDAAVVFRHVDHATGEERFIYHGNDGTSLPWNDTAQLDYLNPDVREMMIETLISLARRFSVIRIDAAMTLVKQHIQRLWFPPPGEGGDIPSRAEHGLSRREFERRMPEEFWRQVVDRVAAEVPDTLLLAEGFWMMESYFVRSLGMHRVYNSAFMHQLRDEDNAKFRATIASTLAFEPGILERHVNFLTNPDELPAVEQLGGGDKYFALCTLLATLPGLPLFGHGQIEGLREKYGMEYARAYVDETADAQIVDRHRREIMPILKRRRLFASAQGFCLYDVENVAAADHADEAARNGRVLDDVLAFSNRADGQRVLVLAHNRDATVRGRVRRAASSETISNETISGETISSKTISGETLADALATAPGGVVRLDDLVTGEAIECGGRELVDRGLEVELGPYQTKVLLVAE